MEIEGNFVLNLIFPAAGNWQFAAIGAADVKW